MYRNATDKFLSVGYYLANKARPTSSKGIFTPRKKIIMSHLILL